MLERLASEAGVSMSEFIRARSLSLGPVPPPELPLISAREIEGYASSRAFRSAMKVEPGSKVQRTEMCVHRVPAGEFCKRCD